MKPNACQDMLDLVQKTCGLAIDIDDAEEEVELLFQSLREGKVDLIRCDRPTTQRALIEFFSRWKRYSKEDVRRMFPQDRLEELRCRHPYWFFDLDLRCEQQSSREFFNCRIDGPIVVVSFIDGTEQCIDVRTLSQEQLERMQEIVVAGRVQVVPRVNRQSEQPRFHDEPISRSAIEKLLEWCPLLSRNKIVGAINSLCYEDKITVVTRPEIKCHISRAVAELSRRGASPSARELVDIICDALDCS